MINQKIHVMKVSRQIKNGIPSSQPYLLYQNKSEFGKNDFYKLYLVPGKDIKFQVSKNKYCIGFEPTRGEWRTCPQSNMIEVGLFCPSCQAEDFFTCRKTCQGFFCNPKSIQAKALCDINETGLYLTFVGGKFKIGVSLNPKRRWIEQGSIYGTIITKGNGLTIRYYENTIGQHLDLLTVVKNSSKIKFIGENIPSIDSISSNFNKIYNNIKKLDLFDFDIPTDIVDLRSHYGEIPKLKRKVILDNEYVYGKIIGVLGKILVVKDKESYYATDLSKVQGRILTPAVSIKRQRTLYDF